jgi:hypothetical protein
VTRLRFCPGAACAILIICGLCGLSSGQAQPGELEVHVSDLPALTARSPHSSDVMFTALESVFHDKEICCGRNSALDDSVQTPDPKSLKDIADKLQGRHLLSDGRTFMITAEYLTPDQVNAGHLIAMLKANHAPLMMWNSHLYIVSGVTYVEIIDYSDGGGGVPMDTTHKFLLQDVRYSDSRREVTFDRLTDDPSKVQGILFLESKEQ